MGFLGIGTEEILLMIVLYVMSILLVKLVQRKKAEAVVTPPEP